MKRYVLTSKDGIFYKKHILFDDVNLSEDEVEVEATVYYKLKLPARYIEEEYVSVDEFPEIEYELIDPTPDVEVEPTTEDVLNALLGVTDNE